MAWLQRVRNVFRPGRLRNDIARELSFHIEERADELRAGGLSDEEAWRLARRQFGNLTAEIERTRDMDITAWLDSSQRNIRYAVRTLLRTPGFTATVVLTLAVSIGANSALFSALNAVLLRPLPFPDPDRLVELSQTDQKSAETLVAPVRLEDWNRLSSTFDAMTGYNTEDVAETSGELPEKVRLAYVAPRFFDVWRIAPAFGRGFTASDHLDGAPLVAVMSDRYWRTRFGADPDVLGRTLRLDNRPYAIVGVMPASFRFPDREVDVWHPRIYNRFTQSRLATWYFGVGRLKPGISLTEARADLDVVQRQLAAEHADTDSRIGTRIEPFKETVVGEIRGSLWLLFGAVSLLLLIACTNIAALLLARAVQRQGEIAVRLSLGASRLSVAAQSVTETAILALAGALAGLLVAAGASAALRDLASSLPRADEMTLDSRILVYTLGCAVLVTILCGVLPAIRGTRGGFAGTLVEAGRTQVSTRHSLQWLLVAVQVALSVTLLAGAGLLLRSFHELSRADGGFDLESRADLPDERKLDRDGEPGTDVAADRAGPRRPAHAAGCRSGGSRMAPGRCPDRLRAGARARRTTRRHESADARRKPRGLIELLRHHADSARGRRALPPSTVRSPLGRGDGEPKLRGSLFSPFFPRRFAPQGLPASGPHRRHRRGRARARPRPRSGPTVYFCEVPVVPTRVFLVRMRGEPMAMAQAVRVRIKEVEPLRSVYDITPLDDRISDSFVQNWLRTVLLVLFAITALLLACVGLYGTLGYIVSLRRREVGLRLALGASRSAIVKHFLTKGLRVAGLACACGLMLSLAFSRLLSGMLYGVSPTDPVTLSSVVVIVLLVAGLASLIPAARAALVEPMRVLRNE